MAGLSRIALEMQWMQHLNDYPIYFLAPSKINWSFEHSHIVIQPRGINCYWELSESAKQEIIKTKVSAQVRNVLLQKEQLQTSNKYIVLSLPIIIVQLGKSGRNQHASLEGFCVIHRGWVQMRVTWIAWTALRKKLKRNGRWNFQG